MLCCSVAFVVVVVLVNLLVCVVRLGCLVCLFCWACCGLGLGSIGVFVTWLVILLLWLAFRVFVLIGLRDLGYSYCLGYCD